VAQCIDQYVFDMPLDEVAPADAGDPTPLSVRSALEVMARHGHLTPTKLRTLSPEEFEAITGCIEDLPPWLAMELADAFDAGDQFAVLNALHALCGWLSFRFDQEATRNLRALPEAERESFWTQDVTQENWRQLRHRAKWHSSQQRFRREAYCPALRIRRGGQRTRRVRRRVASSPRRARAPSHLDDPDLAPLHLARAVV
jgi:hypothetical protein